MCHDHLIICRPPLPTDVAPRARSQISWHIPHAALYGGVTTDEDGSFWTKTLAPEMQEPSELPFFHMARRGQAERHMPGKSQAPRTPGRPHGVRLVGTVRFSLIGI